MGDRLDSAWNRVGRVDTHLREIQRRVDAFEGSNPYAVREEINPSRNEIFYHVRIVRQPSPRWDSLVADCLHNYRSALDHLVWVLTDRHGTATAHSTFPVYLKRAEYRVKVRRDIGDTGRCGAKAIIEGFQPYKARNWGDHNPLWLLHELDRYSKHRILGEIVALLQTYDLGIVGPPEAPSVSFDHHGRWWHPEQRNTMTVHISLFSHSVTEVEVQFAPVVGVGILQPHLQHPGPLPLLGTLDGISTTVRRVLTKLEPICEKP